MRIAVLGTGMVGRALAGRLVELGHHVVIGTRDVERTLARTDPDGMGTPSYALWQQNHPEVRLVTMPEAGAHAEVVLNATAGIAALDALAAVGAEHLDGKVLIDLAIPLDFSAGMPPRLTIANDDSLGEQVQRTYPRARVVKALNTVFCEVMVNPALVPGDHTLFVAGDDAQAKEAVIGLLAEMGWTAGRVIDLGGITSARCTEMYMQLYFTLVGVLDTFHFNIQVNRA